MASGRPDGDWGSQVGESKPDVTRKAMEMKRRWEEKGFGPYIVLVGLLSFAAAVLTADRLPTAAVWAQSRADGGVSARSALDTTILGIQVSDNGISADNTLILKVLKSTWRRIDASPPSGHEIRSAATKRPERADGVKNAHLEFARRVTFT